MEYDSDYHVNLGSLITFSVIREKFLDSVLIRSILITENKPLMPTNIVFFDFKLCLQRKTHSSFEFV